MDRFKTIIKSSPVIIALIYVLVGFLWIQYSDQLVFSMFKNNETLTWVQSLKGWFFVTASGILIYFLIKKSNDILTDFLEEIKQTHNKFEATFRHAPIGIAHHKPNEKWILVNKTLCDLLGYKESELLNLNFQDFIHPDDLERGREMDKDLTDGKISSFKTQKKYIRKDGSTFIGKLTKAAVFDSDKNPLYLITIVEDISEQIDSKEKLEDSLNEKEILISEVHHRVKNNLALMSALLELQLMHTENRDVIEILEHYKTRLKTLSLIHEKYSDHPKEATIDFSWYLHRQIGFLKHIFNYPELQIQYKKDIDQVNLNINQAIPVGLICNELLINAHQHDFNNIENPVIDISVYETEEAIKVTVKNNGKITDQHFDFHNPDSLDSEIIQALVKQIEGDISFTDENGYQIFELTFSIQNTKGSASYSYPQNYQKRDRG